MQLLQRGGERRKPWEFSAALSVDQLNNTQANLSLNSWQSGLIASSFLLFRTVCLIPQPAHHGHTTQMLVAGHGENGLFHGCVTHKIRRKLLLNASGYLPAGFCRVREQLSVQPWQDAQYSVPFSPEVRSCSGHDEGHPGEDTPLSAAGTEKFACC